MNHLILLVLFILTSCSQLTRMPSQLQSDKHVVFDIDWTIVAEVKNPSKELIASKKLLLVEDHYYIAHNGLQDLIVQILNKKDVNISFFSGGKKSRNAELLSKIKLSDGRSFSEIAYKILSSEDLVKVEGALENAPFAERYKKNLQLVSKNLDQLIMFDDTIDFVLEGNSSQKNHVFHMGVAFEHFESFKEAEGLSGKYIPKTYDQWLLNNNRLVILKGAFLDAYDESLRVGISFSEAMKKKEKLLDFQSHEWNIYSESYFKKKSLKVESGGACFDGLKVFF